MPFVLHRPSVPWQPITLNIKGSTEDYRYRQSYTKINITSFLFLLNLAIAAAHYR